MTLRVLAVDDERPALDELAFLLGRDPRVAAVHTASDGATALRLLQETPVDAVFLDIRMPGLTGLDLARVLGRFRQAPVVVFVSAYDDHAVDAFEVKAVDYVMKPVREQRLREAVRRVSEARRPGPAPVVADVTDETIPVELGGVTRFIQRSDIRYAEAQGDYARLHTSEGSHLVRIPLSTLEERWAPEGFVRIHRSHLVAIGHIVEVRSEGGRVTVEVAGGDVLQVSRRHTRELRDRLIRQARPGREGAGPS
jgi:DNA-binding LytR/AlgR family response regulator